MKLYDVELGHAQQSTVSTLNDRNPPHPTPHHQFRKSIFINEYCDVATQKVLACYHSLYFQPMRKNKLNIRVNKFACRNRLSLRGGLMKKETMQLILVTFIPHKSLSRTLLTVALESGDKRTMV